MLRDLFLLFDIFLFKKNWDNFFFLNIRYLKMFFLCIYTHKIKRKINTMLFNIISN